MTEARARAFLPIYAETPIRAREVRIMKKEHKASRIRPILRAFTKRYGIALLLIAAFFIQGCAVAALTERRVTQEVTARVTSELRTGFQSYLVKQETERQAAAFLAGDASLEAAMAEEADALARLLYGYRNNSLRDRKTLIWCVLMRIDSTAYPNTVDGVVNQAQQWMFYSIDNPIREDDRELALEQLRAWHAGTYPSGLSTEFVYAEWSQNDIALRNEFQTSSKTSWWRYPET